MTLAQEPIIFSSDVVKGLPLYYRAMVQRLVDTGRAVLKDPMDNKAVSP